MRKFEQKKCATNNSATTCHKDKRPWFRYGLFTFSREKFERFKMTTQPKMVGYISDRGTFVDVMTFNQFDKDYQVYYTPVFTNPVAGGSFGDGFKAGMQEAILYHKRELNHYSTNSGQVDGVPFPIIASHQLLHLKALQARLALLTGDDSIEYLLITSPEEFMRDYLFELETGGTYQPSEHERRLIADAIAAYTSDRRILDVRKMVEGE